MFSSKELAEWGSALLVFASGGMAGHYASLGMTPVHLNRVMKELRASGAMTLQRGSLIIEDPVRLIKIAGFDENYLHRRLRSGS